jgi:hypothetical protein
LKDCGMRVSSMLLSNPARWKGFHRSSASQRRIPASPSFSSGPVDTIRTRTSTGPSAPLGNGFRRAEDVRGVDRDLKEKLDAEAPTHFEHLVCWKSSPMTIWIFINIDRILPSPYKVWALIPIPIIFYNPIAILNSSCNCWPDDNQNVQGDRALPISYNN